LSNFSDKSLVEFFRQTYSNKQQLNSLSSPQVNSVCTQPDPVSPVFGEAMPVANNAIAQDGDALGAIALPNPRPNPISI
jgi:hypothetical protein